MSDEINILGRVEENQYILRSQEELKSLYGEPHERSVLKVKNFLDAGSRAFIEAAPFAVFATSDEKGNLWSCCGVSERHTAIRNSIRRRRAFTVCATGKSSNRKCFKTRRQF